MKSAVLYAILATILISGYSFQDETDSQPDNQPATAKNTDPTTNAGNTSGKSEIKKAIKTVKKKPKNFVEWLFFADEKETEAHRCNPEFIHSYRLFVKTDREED